MKDWNAMMFYYYTDENGEKRVDRMAVTSDTVGDTIKELKEKYKDDSNFEVVAEDRLLSNTFDPIAEDRLNREKFPKAYADALEVFKKHHIEGWN